MIRAALLLLALASHARADLFDFGTGGAPGGFSVWHGDHWDPNGIHVDPVAAPEASPTLAVAAFGAALIMRRSGGAK